MSSSIAMVISLGIFLYLAGKISKFKFQNKRELFFRVWESQKIYCLEKGVVKLFLWWIKLFLLIAVFDEWSPFEGFASH